MKKRWMLVLGLLVVSLLLVSCGELQAGKATAGGGAGGGGGIAIPAPFAYENSFLISKEYNHLELFEPLSSVYSYLNKDELSILNDGSVSNKFGTVDYAQYLYLPENGYVKFAENDNNVVGDFLYFSSGEIIAKYELHFKSPFRSQLKRTKLVDFNNKRIILMGKTYTLTNALKKGDFVKFNFASKKKKETLSIEDNDFTTTDIKGVLRINGDIIDGVEVNIDADFLKLFSLNEISIKMIAEDDFYVPEGGKLSEVITAAGEEKEVLFTNNWDIEYQGLTEEETHNISLKKSGSDKYELEFVSNDGETVEIPLMYVTGGKIYGGKKDGDNLVFDPGANITDDDYFVLATKDTATAANSDAVVTVLRYISSKNSYDDVQIIKFKNLNTNENIERTFVDACTFDISLNGRTHTFEDAGGGCETDNWDIRLTSTDYVYDIEDEISTISLRDASGTLIQISNNKENEELINNPATELGNEEGLKLKATVDDPDKFDGYVEVPEEQLSYDLIYREINEVTAFPLLLPFWTETDPENSNFLLGYTKYGSEFKQESLSSQPTGFILTVPENQRFAQVYVLSELGEEDTTPPIVIILNPANNSIITTDSTLLEVTTDENAVCEYQLGHFFKKCNNFTCWVEGGTHSPISMSITGGTSHSQLITGLENTINDETQTEWYSIHVECTDSFGNSNSNSVIFFVDLPETDVAITDIIISPENPELGDTINASIIVQNLGNVTTNISISGGFTGPGFGGGGASCPYCIVLEPDETHITPMSFTASAEGEYQINANVDSYVHDINPDNNQLSITFFVGEEETPELDLINYPGLFITEGAFDGYFVIGRNAPPVDRLALTYIATSIENNEGVMVNRLTRLDTEIEEDVGAQDLIVVGRPCENSVTSKLLGYPISCTMSLKPNQATIKLVPNGKNAALLVFGYDAERTLLAAEVLSNYPIHDLSGTEILIGGTNYPDFQIIGSERAKEK